MPGQYRYSVDRLNECIDSLLSSGIDKILLFGIPQHKDAHGSGAYAEEGIIQQALRSLQSYTSDILRIADVCLCEYTDHGHCGLIENGDVDNDATLPLLAKTAVSCVEAGADIVAPSDMMDGRVASIRSELDKKGFEHIPIISYAVKYASSYYGPFRDAAESAPQFGDRRTYQMDPANSREAVKEALLDIAEGADMIMVKPALAYLDILAKLRPEVNLPLLCYNVSGEYSMVKAAAQKGWIDERQCIEETLLAFFRAGADMVITYFCTTIRRVYKTMIPGDAIQALDNAKAFDESLRYIAGGVNSPVRAFKAVGGCPITMARADGAYMWDVEGNRYLDFLSSWGPLILGHRHPRVMSAITSVLEQGTSFGTPNRYETLLAKAVVDAVPGIEKVRMVNSGTEATMAAIRLARAYTGRENIVKCEGCYHGHADPFLVKAGSGAATLGVPTSPGVPQNAAAATLTVPYNDADALAALFEQNPDSIAAIILEPVAGNMGVVMPIEGYLQSVRDICNSYGAVLIFDEVITGFRLGLGGAQEWFGVTPDLTTLGKIIGGGLPVGAFGGKADIMAQLAPEGNVYQAGTLSGNPLAMAAGLATLGVLQEPEFYQRLSQSAEYFFQGLQTIVDKSSIPLTLNTIASMGCLFFTEGPVRNFSQALQADTERYARFFHAMVQGGLYIAPAQYECCFVSAAHQRKHLDIALNSIEDALGVI